MYSAGDLHKGGVAPFGHPRINDRSHLPAAFRSVPRPSSPLGAKASTERPCLTHHPTTLTPARSTKPRNKPKAADSKPLRLPLYATLPFPDSPVKDHPPGPGPETRRHLRRFWKHATLEAHRPRDTSNGRLQTGQPGG